MSRYVDADAAPIYLSQVACEQIKNMPTANVQELKYCRNLTSKGFICSRCGYITEDCKENFYDEWGEYCSIRDFKYNYYPKCGARVYVEYDKLWKNYEK